MLGNVQNLHGEYQNVLLPTGHTSLLDLANPNIPRLRLARSRRSIWKKPMSKRLCTSSKDLDRYKNRRNMQSRNRSSPSENTFDILSFGDLSQEDRSWQTTLLVTRSVDQAMHCIFAPCATTCVLRTRSCIPQWLVPQPPRSSLLPLSQDELLLLVPVSSLP